MTVVLQNTLSEDVSIMFPGHETVLANGVQAQPQFDGGGNLTSLTNVAVANGGSVSEAGITIDAIPAYNTTEGRTNFHPQGRDNGYVLTFDGFRTYISGDTEDIPEMRALKDIDLAFVCMNLPFTMDVNQAASAINEFKPKHVYPYHYRGRDDGTQDPAELAKLVGEGVEVMQHDWYGEA